MVLLFVMVFVESEKKSYLFQYKPRRYTKMHKIFKFI